MCWLLGYDDTTSIVTFQEIHMLDASFWWWYNQIKLSDTYDSCMLTIYYDELFI